MAILPSGIWLDLFLVERSHLTLEVPSEMVRLGSAGGFHGYFFKLFFLIVFIGVRLVSIII